MIRVCAGGCCSSAPTARAVVLTASYEARASNAGSAMPMERAKRLCPEALVVPPRFERYEQVSEIFMETLATFSPLAEPLSLDEAFLDMPGSMRLFGDPESIGRRIKEAIRERRGVPTVWVGISGTRYVAKVRERLRKARSCRRTRCATGSCRCPWRTSGAPARRRPSGCVRWATRR
jgi:DNA polymerase-4